jgi:hypothetical protein
VKTADRRQLKPKTKSEIRTQIESLVQYFQAEPDKTDEDDDGDWQDWHRYANEMYRLGRVLGYSHKDVDQRIVRGMTGRETYLAIERHLATIKAKTRGASKRARMDRSATGE